MGIRDSDRDSDWETGFCVGDVVPQLGYQARNHGGGRHGRAHLMEVPVFCQ